MLRAFQVHPNDNVATLLDDASGTIQVLGPQPQEIRLLEKISSGHKVALTDIAVNKPNGVRSISQFRLSPW